MPRKTKGVKKKTIRTKRAKNLGIKRIKPVKTPKKELLTIEPTEEPVEYVFDLPQEEVKIQNAPMLRRLGAFFIDALLIYFVFFQIFMLIYLPMIGFPAEAGMNELQEYFAANPAMMGKVAIGMFALLVIGLFYFTLTEKVFRKSLGKKMMGLEIVFKYDRNYGRLLLRNLTKTILFPFLVIDLLGIFFNKNGQRFTEKLAGSKVIYEPKLNVIYDW